jgi:hypothetical protein
MRDLKSKVKPELVFGPAVLAADQNAVDIDLQGYRSAMILLLVGAGGITFDASNRIEFVMSDSDDDSTYEAVTDADVDSADAVGAGGVVKALTAAHASSSQYRVGYRGGKRYVRLDIEFVGTHGTGTAIAVQVLKGDANMLPVP